MIIYQKSNYDKEVEEIYNWVKPDYFVTFSLKSGISRIGFKGTAFIAGDDIIYEKAFHSYLKSLSSKVFPRRWRKCCKLSVRCAATIEGGAGSQEPHIHAIMRKPSYISDADFERYIKETALRNPWMKDGRFAINIQKISETPLKLTDYITKKGYKRVIL